MAAMTESNMALPRPTLAWKASPGSAGVWGKRRAHTARPCAAPPSVPTPAASPCTGSPMPAAASPSLSLLLRLRPMASEICDWKKRASREGVTCDWFNSSGEVKDGAVGVVLVGEQYWISDVWAGSKWKEKNRDKFAYPVFAVLLLFVHALCRV
jgi:hypothetical protein